MTFLSLTKSDPQQGKYLSLILEKLAQKLAHCFNPKKYSSTSEEVEGFDLDRDSNFIPAIEQLSSAFNISSDEQEILLLCAGLELNPIFSYLITQISSNLETNNLTLPLIKKIFPNSNFHIHHHESPLLNWQLISIAEGRLTESPIKIDRRIYYYLLGSQQLEPSLESLVQPINIENHYLSCSHQEITDSIAQLWNSVSHPIIQLTGAESSSKLNIAAVISKETEYPLYSTSLDLLSTDLEKLNQFVKLWQREYLLNPNILLLDCASISANNPEQQKALSFLLTRLNVPIIITSRDRMELPLLVATWDIPPLTLDEQRTVWQNSLGDNHP